MRRSDVPVSLGSGRYRRWIGPFVVKTVFSHGTVEISDTKNENYFKVYGQHLKSFLKSVPVNETTMGFFDPVYR